MSNFRRTSWLGPKGGFFQKVQFVFQISQSPKYKYSQKLSWARNLNLLFTVIGKKFKFQGQDSFLEYFYSGDWEVWKTHPTFWKKATFKKQNFGPKPTYSKETTVLFESIYWLVVKKCQNTQNLNSKVNFVKNHVLQIHES